MGHESVIFAISVTLIKFLTRILASKFPGLTWIRGWCRTASTRLQYMMSTNWSSVWSLSGRHEAERDQQGYWWMALKDRGVCLAKGWHFEHLLRWQGSHGSWKILKFEFGFFRTWKVLKLDRGAENSWIWLVCSWKTKSVIE